MKRHLLFLLAICLGGLMAVSCDRNNENGEGGGSGSGSSETKIAIQYQMKDSFTQTGGTATVSPCFHYNVKYVDATGKTVEVNNISAPWTLPVFDVKSPYTAKIEGTIVYNESDLPEEGPINFGAVPNIHVSANGKTYDYGDPITGTFSSKQQFLDFIATHPDRLKFKVEKTF